MLSDEEKAVLKTAKENYGLTSVEQGILVNLIEKQSKEIEELNYIKRCFDYCVEQENKKWEDKIKAKIEELEKEIITGAKKTDIIRRAIIYELQSLLEKE